MKTSTIHYYIVILILVTVSCEKNKSENYQYVAEDKDTLITLNIEGPISGDNITFNVYLPDSYSDDGEGLPVIYFLHGRGGSYKGGGAFRTAIKKAITDDLLRPVICVFPDGTKNGWYADSKDSSNLIETHIIREILPWVDDNFNTMASRDFRVIQGFSMGGYGASLLAVKFPELFSICINYDGAMWAWENMTRQSGEWPPVAPVMFSNDQTYYDQNSSPWTFAERNKDIIKDQVQFRTIVGSLGGGLQYWRDYFTSLGLEMVYVETSCQHNLTCLHAEAGRGSFLLMENQFKDASLSAADLMISTQ